MFQHFLKLLQHFSELKTVDRNTFRFSK